MLASLILWSYIIFSSFIYGQSIVGGFRRLFRIDSEEPVALPLVLITGLGGSMVLAALLSLFIPLGWLAQAIYLILGLFLLWQLVRNQANCLRVNLEKPAAILIILFCLIFLTILENGTHTPSNPDTGIYHAQAIRWIETFPAVPGLGNLHSRLAYDSNWLVINAFYSFSFLGLRSFHVLPGAFVLVAMFYFLQGGQELIEGKVSLAALFKLLLVPLVFYTLGSEISSPGTDFPSDLLLWITLIVWLEALERHRNETGFQIHIQDVLVFFFSILLVTIKLSSLPVLLIAAMILSARALRKPLDAVKLIVLGVLTLAPWLVRNLILSGYWVYPVPAIAMLSPNWDWKIPLRSVIGEKDSILAWARLPRQETALVMAMPLKRWMMEWFANQTANRRMLILAAAASPVSFALSAWLGLRKKPGLIWYILTFASVYAGVLFWLFDAPDIRFGNGIIISAVLFSLLPALTWLFEKTRLRKALIFGLIGILVVFQAMVLVRSLDAKTLSDRLLLPADYASLATAPCQIHATTLMCAEYYDVCGYDAFPCIPPGSASRQVEMRGASLRDGYRTLPVP